MKTTTTYLSIIIVVSIFLPFLTKGQASLPTADFEISINRGCAPLTVNFTNLSTNASDFEWHFGNGKKSTIYQPTVVYQTRGTFNITLIAKDSLGNKDSLTLSKAVVVNEPPNANFTYTLEKSCLRYNKLKLTNLSEGGENYTWDFGDGNSSTDKNPTYSYLDSGSYHVKLMVSDSLGCSSFKQASQAITITEEPKISFSASDTLACDTSQLISFDASATHISDWSWDFGNGDTSRLPNPSCRFRKAGKKTIKLVTTSNLGCQDTILKKDYITVASKSAMDFTPSSLSGCAPFTLKLNAKNIKSDLSYRWTINDSINLGGDTSMITLKKAGNYSIQLFQEDQHSCVDSIEKKNLIKVLGVASANFSVDSADLCTHGQLSFKNKSINGTNFHWDFGDSSYSTAENPTHRYSVAKEYPIMLSVTDSLGCHDTLFQKINVKDFESDFSVDTSKGCNPLTVQFRESSSQSERWLWDFGDGDTSHQQEPVHSYVSSGSYTVSLLVESKSGCKDSIFYKNLVTVYNDTIKEGLSDTIRGCFPLPIDFSKNTIGSSFWHWDFGNGDTSSSKNPSYTYNAPGIFTVSLNTLTTEGCPLYIKNYLTISIDSIVPEISTHYFDCANLTVHLSDSTEDIISWFWNFGDGTYSTDQSPVHKYKDSSIYDVTLTLTTSSGCIQSIFFPQFIDFSRCAVNGVVQLPAQGGAPSPTKVDSIKNLNTYAQKCAPQIVQFANPDTNAFSWHWDFGDGDTSAYENPLHTYKRPGFYDVSVITENTLGFDTTVWKKQVEVKGPEANFSTSFNYECDSVAVQFNNHSKNYKKWLWSFPNSYSSTDSAPLHRFPYSHKNHAIQLRVMDSSHCSASTINIINFSKSSIGFTSPSSACVGDSLLFFASDSTYNYLWDFGDGTTDSSHTQWHVFENPGHYPIKVSQEKNGCSEIHLLDSIKVSGLSAKFTMNDSIGCLNNKFSMVPNELNADSYAWTWGDNGKTNSPSPKIKFDKTGEHFISLSLTKNGCSNSFTHPTPVKVMMVKADFKTEQINYCYPLSVNVTDTNSSSISWKWSADGSTIKGTNKTTFKVHDKSLYVSLKIEAKNGCIDSVTKKITPPVLESNFTFSDTAGCAPFVVDFKNRSKYAVASFWDFGDGDTSTLKDPSHLYKTAGIYTVRLISKSIDGCLDTLTYADAITVSSIQANYSMSSSGSCAPMIVNFKSESPEATSWRWDFGNGKTSKARNPLFIYNNAGVFDVSLAVSNHLGCKDTLYRKEQIRVPGPITKFSVSDSIICGISPVSFKDSSQGAKQWNWVFGDGNTSTQQNPTHTFALDGEYSITLNTMDSAGCKGFYTFPNRIKTAHAPEANFNLKDTIGCTPFSLHLQNHSKFANQWRWNMGDGTLLNDSVPEHIYQTDGKYSISLYVENELGCSDSIQFDSLTVYRTPNTKINTVDPLCENEDALTLQASNIGGIWSGKGVTNKNIGTYEPAVAKHGIDTITYHISGICPSTDTTTVEIKEAPLVDFSVDQTEACYELEANFESLFLEPPSTQLLLDYEWKFNDTLFANSMDAERTFLPGEYEISLKVTSSNGCQEHIVKPSLIKVFDSLPTHTDLTNVSVLNDNEVKLNWNKNEDPAFSHHILYRKLMTDSAFQKVQTIDDGLLESIIDRNLNTLSNIYCFKMMTVDKCGQQLELKDLTEHCTINLEAEKKGRNSVVLKWNEYVGWTVESYEIIRTENQMKPSTVIATLESDQKEYTDSTAYCDSEYSYRIKAIGPFGLQSNSYSDTAKAKMEGIAEFHKTEITRATVENDKSVLIEWEPVKIAKDFANGYVLFKSTDNDSYFPLTFVPKETTSYQDFATNVKEEKYYYRIKVVNACDDQNDFSDPASAILLKSTQINDHQGRIDWTPYEKWSTGIKNFEVQRLNEQNQWETIQVLPPNQHQLIVNF